MDEPPITGSQCRAARALLSWSANELAARASIAVGTIRRVEHGAPANRSTLVLLRNAFKQAGIRFIAEGKKSGPGVRLARRGTAAKD